MDEKKVDEVGKGGPTRKNEKEQIFLSLGPFLGAFHVTCVREIGKCFLASLEGKVAWF